MRIPKAASFLVVLLGAAVGVQAQTVKTTISYPTGVSGIAVDYVAERVYVLLPNFTDSGANAVQVLSSDNATVLATYSVPVANAIAVNMVTGTVYVAGSVPSSTNASGTEGEVVALNGKTGATLATIPVTPNTGGGLVALVVDSLTNKVFAADQSDNAIAVINGKTRALAGLVALNGTPVSLAVNLAAGKVAVGVQAADSLGNPLGEVATLTEKTSAVTYATFGTAPAGVAVDIALNRTYVADNTNFPGSTGVLNARGATLANVTVGDFPQGIDVDPVTSQIYVANAADGSVSRISAISNAVISTITPPSSDAQFIDVDPVEENVWIGGYSSVTLMTEF